VSFSQRHWHRVLRRCIGAIAIAATLIAQPALAQPAPCSTTGSQFLGEGGDASFSPDGKLLAYEQPDAKGISHLYASAPDGTGKVCLSCQVAPSRNVLQSAWSPDGQWLITTREADNNPLAALGWSGQTWVTELEENGLWTDIWAVKPDGSQWTKLTNVSVLTTDGDMSPSFSRDGQHVVWSELTANAGQSDPWGTYRLVLADFVVTNGTPALQNVRNITPTLPGHFFESNGFSPDGSKVLFASDSGALTLSSINVWSLDLASGKATNLTNDWGWNEHATYTPDGSKIVFFNASWPLVGDLWEINPDGTGKVQLTHFNTPGYPEYDPKPGMAITPSFAPDGSKLAITYQLALTYPERQLFVLGFAGSCG